MTVRIQQNQRQHNDFKENISNQRDERRKTVWDMKREFNKETQMLGLEQGLTLCKAWSSDTQKLCESKLASQTHMGELWV